MSEDLTEHAHLSPSGSKKWFACPGSLVLEAPIPNTPNKYSDDGTACHVVLKWCLDEWRPAAEKVGELIPVNARNEEPRYVRFTDDMVELVQPMADTIRVLMIGASFSATERRVDFSDVVQMPNQFGTVDVTILRDRELQIHDAKFGHTPVFVEENSQLLIYALAAYLELELAYDIDTIRLFIHQPKVLGTTEWTCSVEWLTTEFAQTLHDKAAATIGAAKMHGVLPDPEWQRIYLNPKPNELECAFCRALATCPAAQRELESTVGASFNAIVDAGGTPELLESAPALLSTMMAAVGFVEDWCIAVRAECERSLLSGIDVPGFGLELGRKGPRKWRDEAAVEQIVKKTWRLKNEDAYDMSLKSPTALERLTKARTETVDGKAVLHEALIGARQWKKIVEDQVVQNDPKPSVKPAGLIKKPYTPPALDGSGFSAQPDEDPAS